MNRYIITGPHGDHGTRDRWQIRDRTTGALVGYEPTRDEARGTVKSLEFERQLAAEDRARETHP